MWHFISNWQWPSRIEYSWIYFVVLWWKKRVETLRSKTMHHLVEMDSLRNFSLGYYKKIPADFLQKPFIGCCLDATDIIILSASVFTFLVSNKLVLTIYIILHDLCICMFQHWSITGEKKYFKTTIQRQISPFVWIVILLMLFLKWKKYTCWFVIVVREVCLLDLWVYFHLHFI